MKRGLLALAGTAVAALATGTAALSGPATPVVDRDLPTANLNNAAGADRSNVAWSQGNDSITGDTVTVGAPGETWVITAIRTWNIGHVGLAFGDEFTDDTLYFGTGAIAPVATGTVAPGSDADSNPSITHTRVTYADGSDYQAQDGTARQLWQNDFRNLSLTVAGGQPYDVAVDGTSPSYFWFNHASNAALAGSPQDGADGTYLTWSKSDLSTPVSCDSNGPISGCDGGWDKSSDIDVQVFASQVATQPQTCKRGGWRTAVREDGTRYRNQGACVSYARHHDGVGKDDERANTSPGPAATGQAASAVPVGEAGSDGKGKSQGKGRGGRG